jgi:DNA polymerase-1
MGPNSSRRKLMLVDCNSICHSVKYATAGLSYRGRRTGVLFGFIKTLLKLQEVIKADNWLFAWDSDKGYLRQKEYKPYKANRVCEKTPEENKLDEIAYPQFALLRSRLLKELGFANIVKIDGFESDDILASAVQSQYAANYDNYMVTRDKDMYQCLSENVKMFDFVSEKMFTVSDLAGKWGCTPSEWVQAMSFAGCPGDNVIGISGIGMKTAIKFVKNQLKKESKAYQKIVSDPEENVETRFSMVYLPHWRTPFIEIKNFDNDPSANKMIAVASNNGMRSLLTPQFRDRWEEAFKV